MAGYFPFVPIHIDGTGQVLPADRNTLTKDDYIIVEKDGQNVHLMAQGIFTAAAVGPGKYWTGTTGAALSTIPNDTIQYLYERVGDSIYIHIEPDFRLNPKVKTLQDADGDTKIEVERTNDNDIIHFSAGSNEIVNFQDFSLNANRRIILSGDGAINTKNSAQLAFTNSTLVQTALIKLGNVNGDLSFYTGAFTETAPQLNIESDGSGIGINIRDTDPSAALDVTSTTQGVLLPRMTTAQRDAIATPADGLTLYNTTEKAMEVYDCNAWVKPGGAISTGNFYVDIGSDPTVVLSASNTDTIVLASGTAGILTSDWTYSAGTLTYIGTETDTFEVVVSLSSSYSSNNSLIKGWVYQEGVKVPSAAFVKSIGITGSTSINDASVQAIVVASQNDTFDIRYTSDVAGTLTQSSLTYSIKKL
jgi:hypothetical protein